MATFDEMREVMKGMRSGDIPSSKKLWDFAGEIESVATEIFRDKDDSYIADFISLVLAASLTYFTVSGGMDITKAMLLSKDEDVLSLVSMCVKLTVGLSVSDELR